MKRVIGVTLVLLPLVLLILALWGLAGIPVKAIASIMLISFAGTGCIVIGMDLALND